MMSEEIKEEEFPVCRGCGYCCSKAPCALSMELYKGKEPCPALYWNGTMYRCGLAPLFEEELAIGVGCSSSLNDWRQDVRERG
jgi:hypothetical protein